MKENALREELNWIPLVIMMIFFGGTWISPMFYHVTERYNSLIIFFCLAVMFFINVDWTERLKAKDSVLIATAAALLIATVNLFIIGSNKGCILIIADFLLLLYLSPFVRLSSLQYRTLAVFFLLMYGVWFVHDMEFSYNTNTGATYTVFSLFAALILLRHFAAKKEIMGYFIVLALLRTGTLVMWHLARGAFSALFFFSCFYLLFLIFDPAGHKRAYAFLSCFAVFGSLLFVWAYVSLSRTGYNARMPFFYKNVFSGREEIWTEVWNMLKARPLLGIGSGYELSSFFEYNMHNAMYDILIVHGFVVFAIAAYIIISRLIKMRDHIKRGPYAHIAGAAVFAIFFESFIDMDLMWADYTPVLLFLMITVYGGADRALCADNPEEEPGVPGDAYRVDNT
ncbi:MAG: O-antigen ligase family protein [Lachnospiraceae bacterium]|nr:O-antigen ligase family protein [Lachnospiraceae bacterium]